MMVARTDKEARLKDFISEALVNRADDPELKEPVTLVARNVSSPIATSLLAVLSEGWSFVSALRVIVYEKKVEDDAPSPLFAIPNSEWRWLSDRRFGSAHEQFVAGKSRVWIGDCLGRDPWKRDAFEIYHPADAKIGEQAAASFARLWAVAKPFRTMQPAASATPAPDLIPVAPAQLEPLVAPRNDRP
jgi:hypothetical protein